MNQNLYVVTAKCGHVGKNKYIPIDFPIKAESMKEAAERIRNRPRVKHHHKDAILSIIKVDPEIFIQVVEANNSDLYLKVTSSTDQKRFCEDLEERVHSERKQEERDPWERAKRVGERMRRRMLEWRAWRGRHA
jgi:transposase